jgi:CRP-like cAMP-binding protein
LTTEQKNALNLQKTPRKAGKNQFLFLEGDTIISLPILRSGMIKMMKENHDNREGIVDFIKPGELCMLAYFSDLLKFPFSGVVSKPITYCMVDRGLINSFCNTNAEVNKMMMAGLRKKLFFCNNRLVIMMSNHAKTKVAFSLISLTSKEDECEVEITNDELSLYTGLRKETTSRILADFTKNGWVLKRDKKFVIVNPDKLKSFYEQE